jgi:hypothetical protein
MVLNTTTGPKEYGRDRPGHTINTSRVVEEDLVYEDEGAEIVQVLDAAGWAAAFEDGHHEALIFWCLLDDETIHGVLLGEDGLVDLSNNAETRPGFDGYAQTTNNDKER